MNQYKEYSLEDFVLDARFQSWVRYKHDEENNFWETYQIDNPSQLQDITGARVLLESVYSHYESHLDESEIDFEIQSLLNKVRASKENSFVDKAETENNRLSVFSKTSIFWAAASIVILLGISYVYQHNKITDHNYEKLTAGKTLHEEQNDSETTRIIQLSDSSRITLYPHSKVSFPEPFAGGKREIYLSGAAGFQVSKDPKRPFFVFANDLVTKVLGTSFTVNASDISKKTTVEVSEGKVSVFLQKDLLDTKGKKTGQPKGMVLTANQRMVYERETTNMVKTLRANPGIVTGKKEPEFEFSNTPASEVFEDLETAYQVEIIFDKDVLQDCPVTASLRGLSLFKKLDIICEVIEARYEMLDGQIIVYSKGCKN